MERAVLLEDKDVIGRNSFAFNERDIFSDNSIVINLENSNTNLDEIIKILIESALRISMGNQVKAAQILGISRSTLRYKIKKYNIVCDNFRKAH